MSDIVLHGQGVHLPTTSQSKSIVRKYADLLTAGGATSLLRSAEREVGVDYVSAFFDAVELNGVGAITGSGLAVTSKFLGTMEPKGVPLDGGGAGLFSVLGVLGARTRMGSVARAMAASCTSVFSFRKTEEWIGARKSVVHGDEMSGDDPITEAAKALD
jgi:hypothetical protein